jgi:hypothetical protein
MPIFHSPNYSFYLENYTQKDMNEYQESISTKYVSVIDGHFWIEKDGVIIDDPVWIGSAGNEKKFQVFGAIKYYKPAPEITQKLVIEYMYKVNENLYNVKRDNELFNELVDLRPYKSRKCQFNVLKLLNTNGGKIVFGCCGYKYPNGINQKTSFCSGLPKNAVWWIFGFGKYSVFKDFFHKEDDVPDELVTIEN